MKKYKFLASANTRDSEAQVNQLAEHGWILTQMSASINALGHQLIVAVMEKEK